MYKIHGRRSCPFCSKAESLLLKQGIQYKWVNEGTDEHKFLSQIHGHYTVPLIMDGKRFVGGFTELNKEVHNHTTWQKVRWWIVTALHFFHCKKTYKKRIAA